MNLNSIYSVTYYAEQMSLILRLCLSITRVSSRLPLSINRVPPASSVLYSNDTTDSNTEPNQFKNAHFIECCVNNENGNLPPHLQTKYLPKSIVDRINRRKESQAIRSKEQDWTSFKDIVANLSNKVDNINLHIDTFPKDKKAKASRRIIKFKRKKLFRYLKRMDFPLYEQLREKYQLEEIDILIDKETFLRRSELVAQVKAERKAKYKVDQMAKGIKVKI